MCQSETYTVVITPMFSKHSRYANKSDTRSSSESACRVGRLSFVPRGSRYAASTHTNRLKPPNQRVTLVVVSGNNCGIKTSGGTPIAMCNSAELQVLLAPLERWELIVYQCCVFNGKRRPSPNTSQTATRAHMLEAYHCFARVRRSSSKGRHGDTIRAC